MFSYSLKNSILILILLITALYSQDRTLTRRIWLDSLYYNYRVNDTDNWVNMSKLFGDYSDTGLDSVGVYDYLNNYIVEPGTMSSMRTQFDAISDAGGDALIEFMKDRDYTITGTLRLNGLNNVIIKTNGARFNGSGLNCFIDIASDTTRLDSSRKYEDTIISSDLADNPQKDSTYIVVDDTSDWTSLTDGDIIYMADSTQYYSNSGSYYNAIQVYFQDLRYQEGEHRLILHNKIQATIDTSDIQWIGIIKQKKVCYIDNFNAKNLSLRISGYQNASIGEIVSKSTLASASQHYYAIDFTGCRNWYVGHADIVGWNRSGYGYGIGCNFFERGVVNYIHGIDNRHTITTNSTYRNRNGILEINGGIAEYSDSLKHTWPCWDTHGQVEKIIMRNCSGINGFHFLQIRGESAELYNIYAQDLSSTVVAAVHSQEQSQKPYIKIDGGQAINTFRIFANYDSTRIRRLDVDNFVYDGRSVDVTTSDNYVIQFDEASLVDTVNISNSKFYGSLNNTTTKETYLIKAYPEVMSGTNSSVKILNLKNNITSDMSIFNLIYKPSIDKATVKNNEFNRGIYLINGASINDSSASYMNDWTFEHNEISDFHTLIFFSTSVAKVHNLSFINNTFKYIGVINNSTKTVFNNLTFNRNDYIEAPYGDNYILRTWYLNGNLNFNNNIIWPQRPDDIDDHYNAYSTQGYSYGSYNTQYRTWLRLDKATGYYPKVNVYNNIYRGYGNTVNTGAFCIFDSCEVSFAFNTVKPDTIGDDMILEALNGTVARFDNNLIETYNKNNNSFIIGYLGATIYAQGNTLRALNTTPTLTPIRDGDNSCTVYLGNNIFEGFDNSGSYGGTLHYLPFQYYNTKIDSAKISGSLNFYNGSTQYSMPLMSTSNDTTILNIQGTLFKFTSDSAWVDN